MRAGVQETARARSVQPQQGGAAGHEPIFAVLFLVLVVLLLALFVLSITAVVLCVLERDLSRACASASARTAAPILPPRTAY